jgi:hypothetical protein
MAKLTMAKINTNEIIMKKLTMVKLIIVLN